MEKVSTIGLHIAKNVFQVHGVDEPAVVVRRALRRLAGCWRGLPRCRATWSGSRHEVGLIPPEPSSGRPTAGAAGESLCAAQQEQ
jgi:hypothetical protein